MSMQSGHDDTKPGPGTDTIERTKPKTQKPSMWHVVLLNDDFTPMDFVTFLLMRVFNKNHDEAEAITFQIHLEGKGIAGTYTFEVAESKADDTMKLARAEGHPLKCSVEKE